MINLKYFAWCPPYSYCNMIIYLSICLSVFSIRLWPLQKWALCPAHLCVSQPFIKCISSSPCLTLPSLWRIVHDQITPGLSRPLIYSTLGKNALPDWWVRKNLLHVILHVHLEAWSFIHSSIQSILLSNATTTEWANLPILGSNNTKHIFTKILKS